MELHNKQKEVINSDARFKVLNWGRRSGKTTVISYEAMITLMGKDNSRVAYYAPTFSDAREIAWEIFKKTLHGVIVHTNESLLEMTIKNQHGGTSKLVLQGWESVKNRDKGRGVENDLVILDECAFYPAFRIKYDQVIEPTLLTSNGRAIFTSTPNGFNHFYQLSNDAQRSDNWFYSHATSYDNSFNTKEELERLKKEKPEDSFAQEYLADFRKQSGLVFKEFSRQGHVYTDIEKGHIVKTMVGVDFGFTNPCGIVKVQKNFDRQYFITDEYYQIGKTDIQISQMARVMGAELYYPDPENPGGIQELKNQDLNVRDVYKGKNSVVRGIQIMRELFLQGRIMIHSSCKNLIEEIEGYHYPPEALEKNNEERPVKEADHLIDSLRYCIMMEEEYGSNMDNAMLRQQIRWRRERQQPKDLE